MSWQCVWREALRLGRSPRVWLRETAYRRSFGSALTVGFVTLVSAFARMAKDLALAAWFGTREDVDAYLLAAALPMFVTSVLAGSFNSALVPVYIDLDQTEGEEARGQFLSRIMAIAALVLGLMSALLIFFGPMLLGVLASKTSASEISAATRLYPLVAPMVLLSGLSTVIGGILNARGSFGLPGLTPALSSAVPLLLVVAFPKSRTIEVIAGGTLAGYVVELLILGFVVRHAARCSGPRHAGTASAMKRVMMAYLPMVGGMLVSCASPLVDQLMSTRLGEGAVATLSFAGKIPAFVMGLGAAAVGTAVLPYFSSVVAAKDWTALRRSLWTWTTLILVIYLPLAALAAIFAEPIVRLLFERGAFRATDTATTTRVFLGYLPQLPFYVLGTLGSRLMSALGRNRTMMFIAFVNVAVNFVGDYLLMQWMGLLGIALSTSIVYFVSALLVYVAVRDVIWPRAELQKRL